MDLMVDVVINAPREIVWNVITDIDHAVDNISAIEEIEILERPDNSFVGLKWREVRTLFGKSAEETMWITDAVENESYRTRAENHGAVYVTTFALADVPEGTHLVMTFGSTAQTVGARVMSATMGLFFKNSTQKALMQDLVDIKNVAESRTQAETTASVDSSTDHVDAEKVEDEL